MFSYFKILSYLKNADVVYNIRKVVQNGVSEVYRVLLAYPIFLAAIAFLLLYAIVVLIR